MPDPLAGFAAGVAPEIDRVFRSTMRAIRERGGREVVMRHGPAAGILINFRSALARPGRWVTPAQVEAVCRYQDIPDAWRAFGTQVGAGLLERDESTGALRATEAARPLFSDMYEVHNRVTGERWAGCGRQIEELNALVVRLLAAGGETGGDAYHAVTPPYPHPVASEASLLLDRLGALRYHRADAHASAWQAAGLTVAEIVAMPPGSQRDAIEAETNRLAAPPWAGLSSRERAVFVAHLSAMPG
jgi:hypothetical protein